MSALYNCNRTCRRQSLNCVCVTLCVPQSTKSIVLSYACSLCMMGHYMYKATPHPPPPRAFQHIVGTVLVAFSTEPHELQNTCALQNTKDFIWHHLIPQ